MFSSEHLSLAAMCASCSASLISETSFFVGTAVGFGPPLDGFKTFSFSTFFAAFVGSTVNLIASAAALDLRYYIPVFNPDFHAWKCKEVNLPELASDMWTLNDCDWSINAPRAAAMSTNIRCLISHTVL